MFGELFSSNIKTPSSICPREPTTCGSHISITNTWSQLKGKRRVSYNSLACNLASSAYVKTKYMSSVISSKLFLPQLTYQQSLKARWVHPLSGYPHFASPSLQGSPLRLLWSTPAEDLWFIYTQNYTMHKNIIWKTDEQHVGKAERRRRRRRRWWDLKVMIKTRVAFPIPWSLLVPLFLSLCTRTALTCMIFCHWGHLSQLPESQRRLENRTSTCPNVQL